MGRAWHSAGRTDRGLVRAVNQDAILMRDDAGLWVVADGLGGHAAGEYASGMIVERLGRIQRPPQTPSFVDQIEDTLLDINRDLREETRLRGVDVIASTVVVLIQDAGIALCGWVGDSRVYGFHDGRLQQLSVDHVHSQTADAVADGGGSRPVPAGSAPLSRAVGAAERLFVDWVAAESQPGTRFLLCSDGINKELADAEIEAEFRRQPSPHVLTERLFDVAMARGARDNVTAAVVAVS